MKQIILVLAIALSGCHLTIDDYIAADKECSRIGMKVKATTFGACCVVASRETCSAYPEVKK